MRVPISWLKEFVDIKYSAAELAERLMMTGIDIKSVERPAELANVVVGKVLSIKKHKSADKLSVAKVDVGKQKLEIVCGADNLEVGQKVPVAEIGAVLPDGLKIEKREIRGVVSNGMICSEAELGIADPPAGGGGIMVLPHDTEPGTPYSDLFADDAVIEADITPNRGDQLSMLGIAREAAAIDYRHPKKIKLPDMHIKEIEEPAREQLKLIVKEPKLCRQYAARVIRVGLIEESPDWIKKRLLACGLRPVNAIVDITNYVMLELGQPLHAFDLRKLAGREIVVRAAKRGEGIKTLDGVKRTLANDALVIADRDRAVAIAGVMGGANSEVTAKTRVIVLESAEFDPLSVRKTAHRLGLRTEAASRFEKRIDPKLPLLAVDRAAKMISDICGGQVYAGVVFAGSRAVPLKKVDLLFDSMNAQLGTDIDGVEARRILEALGFGVRLSKTKLTAEVPPHRRDIAIPEDLVEEIARMYGYDKINAALPSGQMKEQSINRLYDFEERLRRFMASAGYYESVNYSFVSEKQIIAANGSLSQHVRITNPISEEFEYMRRSIVPSLVRLASANLRFRDSFGLFEIASVYDKRDRSERRELSYLTTGDFGRVKGVLEALIKSVGLTARARRERATIFRDGASAVILSGDAEIGSLGEISPEVLSAFDIDANLSACVIDIGALFDLYNKAERRLKPLPKFPPALADISFFIKENVDYHAIEEAVSGASKLVSFSLLDIYRGEQVPAGHKSIALSLTFVSDHTLSDKEVDAEFAKIENALVLLGAKVRRI